MRVWLFTAALAASASLVVPAHATQLENGRYVNSAFENGRYVNGRYVNGRYVNSAFPNGGSVGGASVSGMQKDGAPVSYVRTDGSELVGYTWDAGAWTERRGAWFARAQLSASLLEPLSSQIDAITLRIDTVAEVSGGLYPSGARRPNYFVYGVSAQLFDERNLATWEPVCGISAETGAPNMAIALRGAWSYDEGALYGGAKISDSNDALTFACTNAALGKCAGNFRYSPWETSWVESCDASGTCRWTRRDLNDVHQACTRMVRADYCGDGTSHTVTGTPIDVFDDLGMNDSSVDGRHNTPGPIHYDPRFGPDWEFEAAWSPRGSTTASCTRLRDGLASCPMYFESVIGPGGIVRNIPRKFTFNRICYTDPTGALTSNNAVLGNSRKTNNVVIVGGGPGHGGGLPLDHF